MRTAVAALGFAAWLPLIGCSSSDSGANNGTGQTGGMTGNTVAGGATSGGNGGGTSGGAANGGTPSGGAAQGGVATGGAANGGAAMAGGAGGGGGGAAGSAGSAGADMGGTGGMVGNAGAGGTAGLMIVPPIERAGIHTLEFGNTLFEVNGMVGARIVSFKEGGTNILTGPDNNAMFYGSTLWTGPESEWGTNPFMAVAGIDSDPYTMSVEQNSIIVGQSAPFMITTKNISANKRFSADLVKNAIVIDYSLKNEGAAPFDIGLWEVTRVLGQGLTFYPTGASSSTLYGSLAVQAMAGHDWIDHGAFAAGMASKTGADATGGWIAHVQADPGGDLLFIKQFPDVADGMAAPGETEVEVFEQSDGSYIELELHNQYGTIAAGASKAWQVRWYLRRLPAGTDVSVGSQALIDAVTAAIQ